MSEVSPLVCVCSGLRELRLTGLSWSCLSALVSPTLPYLRLLDLRWCEGLKDTHIKEIISPPGSSSHRELSEFFLGIQFEVRILI